MRRSAVIPCDDKNVKLSGEKNDLFDRILSDPIFGLTADELASLPIPSCLQAARRNRRRIF